MSARMQCVLAGVVGLLVAFAGNRLAFLWLHATVFADDAFYDGCALIVTLALPAFVAGLALGAIAREQAVTTAATAFAFWVFVGVFYPFWAIPKVSFHSAHSGLMHYFLYNPLVTLAFGTLGGWLGGQFATGRFTLADRDPIEPASLEE